MGRKRSAPDSPDLKDFVVKDEDDFDTKAERPKSKKQKADFGGTKEGEDTYWEISRNRRVTVSKFKGSTVVSIREVYEKDGKMLPGKKGITLPLEQFTVLASIIPEVDAMLADSGEKSTDTEEPVDKKSKKAKKEKAAKSKKNNFEATSDEEE
ncbi:MAG: hypothetical protein M1814_000450 [Vezdaea aestivalis]|nr:MAG: hypothetical protein M1814_000450 [Vezdaea aestivalis]